MTASCVLQRVIEPLFVRLARLDRGLEGCDLVHEALGSPLILLGLGVADLFGGGVAAGLRALQFLNRCAALLVEAENLIQRRARIVEAAIGQPFDEGLLIFADPFDVEHGATHP